MSSSDPAFETPARTRRTDQLIDRVLNSRPGRLAYRFRHVVPVVSFAIGVGSYFLIQRQNALAQWLTALMLLGWVALLFEGLLCRILARFIGERIPQVLVRYGAQALHQETLFFVLPFFLVTTTWLSAQALFTGLLIVAAVVSAIDPLYYGVIAPRRWLFLGYHAFTLFAAILAGGPIIGALTTGDSIALASAVAAVCALPSLNDVVRVRRWWRWFLLAGASIALGSGAWMARFWIPPATLNAKQMAITTQMNTASREPGSDRAHFTAAELHADGLYAFSAIKAPRGLHQNVLHVWSHNGRVIDRIPLHITGGTRERGYRAWSHKLTLGTDPVGHWRVAVVTDEGQLIGVQRFTVSARRGPTSNQ